MNCSIEACQKPIKIKSKQLGVSRNGEGWRARIKVSGKEIFLGSFKNVKEAVVARREAERLYWNV